MNQWKPTDGESPWLSLVELAAYVRCLKADGTPSADGARQWAKRHGVRAGHRGRRVLYARADVDLAIVAGPDASRRTLWRVS